MIRRLTERKRAIRSTPRHLNSAGPLGVRRGTRSLFWSLVGPSAAKEKEKTDTRRTASYNCLAWNSLQRYVGFPIRRTQVNNGPPVHQASSALAK